MTIPCDSVLLIDDSEIDLFINRKILEFNNFSNNIVSVTSPCRALELLMSSENLPAVIFLDLNMPIMDGFKFIEKFETLPDYVTSRISIVVLTSSNNNIDRKLAVRSSNVVRYISKPLTDEKITKLKEEMALAKSLQN